MTTVAWDGQTLAADSRIVDGHYKDTCNKIFTINGAHIAGAGAYSEILLFCRWFADQTKEKPALTNLSAIVIRGGKAYFYDESCVQQEIHAPEAIGTGAAYAMGAMLAGKNAIEAVKIATKLDVNSGGKIKHITIE